MGDEAEGVFEATYPQGFVKFGLSRPPINLSRVPEFVRYTPDYLTARGMVEVQGFGRDQTMKLKEDKLQALIDWRKATAWRVDLFLWNSAENEFAWVRIPELIEALPLAEKRMFPEGKPYFAWHVDNIPTVDGWKGYYDGDEDGE